MKRTHIAIALAAGGITLLSLVVGVILALILRPKKQYQNPTHYIKGNLKYEAQCQNGTTDVMSIYDAIITDDDLRKRQSAMCSGIKPLSVATIFTDEQGISKNFNFMYHPPVETYATR